MLRGIIHSLRKIKFIKIASDILFMFVFELIGNRLISHIPISMLRKNFYKYILRVKILDNAYILNGCYIYPDLNDLVIGMNTIVNQDVILDRRANLYIGNNVNISREVAIYTGGHEIDSTTFAYYGKSVVIKDYVWIGTRAMIMPGVTIGEGAVILPGAVVTHECEAYTVYGGIPAKKIRMRSKKLEYELKWQTYFL